ncbi:hypothetical protein SAMN05519105_3909 [Rhodobacter sp. 24-YEA-8]|nr:hypothetical protein SAMN05519105_3909 [Rhodobacter sp. 24-YEA-8]
MTNDRFCTAVSRLSARLIDQSEMGLVLSLHLRPAASSRAATDPARCLL